MKTLYIDCSMGAAGDMLTSALLELLPDPEAFVKKLNHLQLPGVTYCKESSSKCGILGTHMLVLVDGEEESFCHTEHLEQEVLLHDQAEYPCHTEHHEQEVLFHDKTESSCHTEHHHDHTDHHHGDHHHTSLREIEQLVSTLAVSEKVKGDILAVYNLIADAESHAHGKPVSEIHFHEVGTMDAVADITAVCLLMEELAPEQVLASPVHVGSGTVHCAHGILPVPAPATTFLLQDVPIYGGSIRSELCTPTGAALLKHFVMRFCDMPVIRLEKTGYGMGKKDFPIANCVRILLGECDTPSDGMRDRQSDNPQSETVCELLCNLDDATGEEIGFAMEQLLSAGALEVFTTPVGMKKNRPGILLTVICKVSDQDRLLRLIFQYTPTLGVRENQCRRFTLQRRIETDPTPYGEIRRKVSEGYGVLREKYEYDDLAQIAREKNISLQEARILVSK